MGEGGDGVAYVRPKWANFSRSASTNLARIWCSLSYCSKARRSGMLALRPTGETLIMPFLWKCSELAFVCVAVLSVSLLLLLLLLVAGMLAQPFSTSQYQLNATAIIGSIPSIPEFHKRPRLDRTFDIRNISQTKIHQFLILLLPQPANEAIACQRLPQSYSRQAIFREAEIEKPRDGD